MGAKPSQELLEYEEKFLFYRDWHIGVYYTNTQKCKVFKHFTVKDEARFRHPYFKRLVDGRCIILSQVDDIVFEINVYDKNLVNMQMQRVTIPGKDPLREINGHFNWVHMTDNEEKKFLYSYGLYPFFLSIDYRDKVELRIQKVKDVIDEFCYTDPTIPHENLHPALRDRTSQLGIPIVCLPDHHMFTNKYHNRNVMTIHGKEKQIYKIKDERGIIHSVYYDKYDHVLIILYFLHVAYNEWRYGIEFSQFQNDEWQYRDHVMLDKFNPAHNDIVDIVASRRHLAIAFSQDRRDIDNNVGRVEIIDKMRKKSIGYFRGEQPNFDDSYDEWFQDKLTLLQTIDALGKFSLALLKLVLLYV